nr:DUF4062 domain-containing protein [Calditrichia bacterium]
MKIFLSAVDPALADIRQNIAQTFGSWDHEVITAEDLPQTLQTDRQERDARVCSADVFVAIYAQRYGEVPQGEHLSLQEVDYRKALEAGKEVFCFTLSPEVNWPESEIEDDFVKKQRLDDLIADMRKRPENHQYQTAADIRSYLKPRIKKLTLVYDRVKLLQQWAAEQSTDSKYQHLTQLADRLGAEKLSEPDFARAASLILRNFDTRDVKPANPLFDDVERFLKNDLSADGLVDKCRTVTRHSWKEVFANYLPWSLVASVVLFLGLGLWAGSWFGGFTARSNDAALARILEKEVPPAPALADLAGESGRPIREALAFVAGQNPDHPALGAIMAQLSDSLQVAMGSAADSTGLVALYSQLNDWCGEGALPLFCEKASLLKTRLAAHQQEAAAREVLAEIRSGGSSGEARAARYRAFLKNYPDFPEAATVRRELAEVEQAVAAEVSKARQDSLDRLKSLAEAGEKARQDSLANLARAAQKAREDSLKALAAARETARRDSLARLTAAREA